MKLELFTDGSVNTGLSIGYGAYLVYPADRDSSDSPADTIRVKLFENTSSTKLELQTLLWALSEISASDIILYTDSQNIAGLSRRRRKLEENDYRSRNGKLLNNHELYKDYYKSIDRLNVRVIQLKGHSPSCRKSDKDKIFSLVDRASRNALRAHSEKSR